MKNFLYFLIASIILFAGNSVFAGSESSQLTNEMACGEISKILKGKTSDNLAFQKEMSESQFVAHCTDPKNIYFTKQGNIMSVDDWAKELKSGVISNSSKSDFPERLKALINSFRNNKENSKFGNTTNKLLSLSQKDWNEMIQAFDGKELRGFDKCTFDGNDSMSSFKHLYQPFLSDEFNLYYICNPIDKNILFYSVITTHISDSGNSSYKFHLVGPLKFKKKMQGLKKLQIDVGNLSSLSIYKMNSSKAKKINKKNKTGTKD